MNKKSQIYLIKEFFTSNDKTIIINQVNDYLRIFTLVSPNTMLINRILK